MASRPKSGRTGNQRNTARSRKPATIDLTAKEVEAEKAKPASAASKSAGTAKTASSSAKPASAKPAASSKSPEFGRTAKTTEKASAAKASESKTDTGANAAKSPDKPVEKEPSVPASGKAGSGIISGLVGAVVAVAGLGAIGQFENARNIPLIGNLYEAGNSETAGAVSGSEFYELQSKVAELTTQNDTRQAIDLDPVNAKIAELENAIKALAQAGSDSGSASDTVLTGRLDAVESGIGELKQALASISATTENSAGTEAGLAKRLETLDARLASVEETASQNPSDTEPFVTIRQRLDDLAGQVGEIEAKSSENASGLASLASQSTELKDTVASVQASEKVARSVAVNALATAIENDDPLTLPIASLEALVGELPETKRMSELAASGIPTVQELAAELDAFANGIQNPTGVSEDASLSDKFWANAQSLVSFRSTGPRDGSDPLAILSRVKDAVKNDNLASAATEWQQLPADIRQTGEPWANRLAIRAEAYALQKEISSKLASQAG